MASNGRLPASALSSIYRGRLRHDAAASWNAMNAESVRRFGVRLEPLGGMSSYRTYDQQVYLWNYSAHPHNTNWVARPGTSNHGWGLAVDLKTRRMRYIIDQIGAKYGWAKVTSDAPGEWWHLKWNGTSQVKVQVRDPLWFLTTEERVKVREWKRLKASGKDHKRRGQLFRWLLERRKNIWRAAQKSGWKKYHRRARYKYLYRLTGG